MGRHDFLDHIPFRMTCVMIAYVLREVMLHCRKCLMGGHVLVECMCSGWHILQYVVFYRKTCLIGGHVLLFEMSFWGTCFTGGHILQDNLLYRGIHLM